MPAVAGSSGLSSFPACVAPNPVDERPRAGAPIAPDIRLAMLRLGELARGIRERLEAQRRQPGLPGRAWPWIRASLGGELDVAFVHLLNALQSLHDVVFGATNVVPVREIRHRVGAMHACIDHTLSLHRDVAAALAQDNPIRAPMLDIIEMPLRQIAGFFDAMQHALQAPIEGPDGHDAEIEVGLSLSLDFAAQIADVELAAATSSRR